MRPLPKENPGYGPALNRTLTLTQTQINGNKTNTLIIWEVKVTNNLHKVLFFGRLGHTHVVSLGGTVKTCISIINKLF